jgi:hypothetical protein
MNVIRVTRGLLLGLLLMLMISRVMAAMPTRLPALSAIPLPEGVRAARILDDASIDGQPLALRQLKTALGCEALLARARLLWLGQLSPHLLAEQRGRWQILSAAFPDGFVNLQGQATLEGPCEALLSRWPLGAHATAPGPSGVRAILPDWPPSVRVLRHTVERREGLVTSVTTAQSAQPLAWLVTTFRRQLESQGYRLDGVPLPGDAAPRARAVIAARTARADLTVLLNATADITDVVLIHDQRTP